jgi:predicted SAM-dependent methyltransferase
MPIHLRTFVKRCLLYVFPNQLLAQMAFEVRASLKFISQGRRTARKLGDLEGVRVNIGCGSHPTKGWVNLDMAADPQIDYWDCRKGLPFKDGALAAIFTEHLVEHLEYPSEISRFLRECRRCLSETGILRIIVPDLEPYLRLYVNDDWEGLAALRPLTPTGAGYRDYWLGDCYSTKMELINALFRQNGEHKFAYDAETLIKLLRSVGFSNVTRAGFGISADPMMVPDMPERRTESLYVEASKM